MTISPFSKSFAEPPVPELYPGSRGSKRGDMTRFRRISVFAVLLGFFLSLFMISELGAFSASESKIFHQGPFAFKLEISLTGNGSLKKVDPHPHHLIEIQGEK